MTTLTPDDLARYEQAAARQVRGLSGEDPVGWGELLAAGQGALGMAQRSSVSVEDLIDEAAVSLMAASRILDSNLERDETMGSRGDVADSLLAAFAFMFHGNAPSALAVARRADLANRLESANELLALTMACPQLLGEVIPRVSNGQAETVLAFNQFLISGDESSLLEAAQGASRLVASAESPFEQMLLGLGIRCLDVIGTLSVSKNLKSTGPMTELFGQRLVSDGLYLLLPPQYRALRDGLLANDANAAVVLPTSSGKTLLGELALLKALGSRPGVVCYVAPYVALGRQILERMRHRRLPRVRVHALMGGYSFEDPLDPDHFLEVVIATPERLDALLKNAPDLARHLRCAVVDEAHIVASGERGVRVEGLVSRLRLMQRSASVPRIVLLSAVIGNEDALASWLGTGSLVIRDAWRPTARRLALWRQDGVMQWMVGDDRVRRIGQTGSSIIGTDRLPWPEPGLFSPQHYGQQRQQEASLARNVGYLLRFLWDQNEEPILCLCMTRAHTRRVAYAAVQAFTPLEVLPEHTQETIGRIEARHGYLGPLAAALKHGVGFHNASLPRDIRQGIENAAEASELRVVAATTTLAEGVDLPFRYSVLMDWLSWSGDESVPMSRLLFRNISGRSGRAGRHTEGETVVVDNPLGDYRFTNDQVRQTLILRTIAEDDPPVVTSALTPEVLGRPSPERAALESQLIAAIPENPASEEIVADFLAGTLAGSRPESEGVASILSLARDSLTNEFDSGLESLAVAASPLRLTDLGVAVNKTGLSPDTCRSLLRELRELKSSDAVTVASRLLIALSLVPEQTNRSVARRLGEGKGHHPVRAADCELSIRMWIEGETLESIFSSLGYVRQSKRRDSIEKWLAGTDPGSTWNEEFDKFVDYVQGPVSSFLPWICRASSQLTVHSGNLTAVVMDWDQIAEFLETGTNSIWAARAMRDVAPASRRTANLVGQNWPADLLTREDPLGLEAVTEAELPRVGAIFSAVANDPDPVTRLEVPRLQRWWWDRLG